MEELQKAMDDLDAAKALANELQAQTDAAIVAVGEHATRVRSLLKSAEDALVAEFGLPK